MISIQDKVLSRITRKKSNRWVFTPTDFLDLGSRAAIDQSLSRLVRDGVIRRVARGLYDVPWVSSLTGKLAPPSYRQLVSAIARRDKIDLVPDSLVHANGLGVTNAVPAKSRFYSSGPTKVIKAGGVKLDLTHASGRFMKNATSPYGPAFQAIHWLGQDFFKAGGADDVIPRLPNQMIHDMHKNINDLPVWMRPVVSSRKRRAA